MRMTLKLLAVWLILVAIDDDSSNLEMYVNPS